MEIKVTFFQAGYCTHPEAIVIRGGRWKIRKFPSLFALISHPSQGAILFDTGYSDRFFQETRPFPFRLYALTTPVYFQPEESAVCQLQQQGIEPEAIKPTFRTSTCHITKNIEGEQLCYAEGELQTPESLKYLYSS